MDFLLVTQEMIKIQFSYRGLDFPIPFSIRFTAGFLKSKM